MTSNKILWILFPVASISFYIIGGAYPLPFMTPQIAENQSLISAYEALSLSVNIVLAILTFLTVIVALLKEEIIKLWRKAILEIEADEQSMFREKLRENSGTSISELYYIKLRLINKGSIDARNCRVHISKITHKNNATQHASSIEILKKAVILEDNESPILPPFSSLDFNLVSINDGGSNSSSAPDASKPPGYTPPKSPILIVAGNEIQTEYHHGVIEIHLAIHSDGMLPVKKIISIRWDGQWKQRLSDICPKHLGAEILDAGAIQ